MILPLNTAPHVKDRSTAKSNRGLHTGIRPIGRLLHSNSGEDDRLRIRPAYPMSQTCGFNSETSPVGNINHDSSRREDDSIMLNPGNSMCPLASTLAISSGFDPDYP